MDISLVAAVGGHNVIGNKGRIPWHLPADLKRFRELTIGKPVIMGRSTFESIGRALPKRINIVLTRDRTFEAHGVKVAHSLEEAIALVSPCSECMVIGGAEIYTQFLAAAERMYLTYVEGEFEGDTYFPQFDQGQWNEVAREAHSPDLENIYPYTFVVLQKK